MLKWLPKLFSSETSGAKSISSGRGVRAIIAQLDDQPPERAIRVVAELFEDIPRRSTNRPSVVAGLMRLDEFIQRSLNCLWQSLGVDTHGQGVSDLVWTTLVLHYRNVHASYWHCLQGHGAGAKAASDRDHADAIVCASRAMTALAKYMLLLRVRYRSATQDVWSQVNALYAWVEDHACAAASLKQYPEFEARTTIEREMLIALLIEVAPTGNLAPGQILALDQLLRRAMGQFRIADTYDEQLYPFAFEAACNDTPRRWLAGKTIRPGVRFFGLGSVHSELCGERDHAKRSGELPGWVASMRCTLEDWVELLDRTISQWSPRPPQRRQRRDACAGELLIAHDWGFIRQLFKFSELASSGRSLAYDATHVYGIDRDIRSYSPRQPQPRCSAKILDNLLSFESSLDADAIDAWSLVDTSENGLGACTARNGAWVKVGMLVAYRLPADGEWRIAIVRRLYTSADHRLAIGMTKVTGRLSSARLRLGIGSVDYSRTVGPSDSIVEYHALVVENTAGCSVLLPSGVIDMQWKYTLGWRNRRDTVTFKQSLQRGLNFEHVEILQFGAMRAA